jgi:hypothetical protein
VSIGTVPSGNELFHVTESRFSLYTNDLDFSSSLNDGDRSHTICTIDSALTQNVWLNGALVASRTSSSYYIGNTTVILGDAPSIGFPLGGSINIVAVYDRVLTPEECRLSYRQPFCMFAPPAWQRWPMDAAAAPSGPFPPWPKRQIFIPG